MPRFFTVGLVDGTGVRHGVRYINLDHIVRADYTNPKAERQQGVMEITLSDGFKLVVDGLLCEQLSLAMIRHTEKLVSEEANQ